jgi:perosamine synthetase
MIPVNTPLLSGNEKKYINEAIDSGWISSEGPFVKIFEEKFSNYIGRKNGVAVSNGSAALDIAVKAIDINKGDEVILPTFTIISPAFSIIRQGGIPVLVDSDPVTWGMDVTKIEEKITPKTKAILVVHIYGYPVDMDPVIELANKYKLKIIEDAAEMHGQTYKGKKCGSFGDISIFSFYPNKHITTGEGGMILTDNEELSEKCKQLRNLCFIPPKRFVHKDIGWNYRMTNLQAALGVAQLEQIEHFIKRKREIGSIYNGLLEKIETIDLMPKSVSYTDNIYWIYGIMIKSNQQKKAEDVMNALKNHNIGSRPFFYPMHLQPVFNKMGLFQNEKYPIAENLAKNGFYIPCGLGISNEEIYIVAQNLKKIFKF